MGVLAFDIGGTEIKFGVFDDKEKLIFSDKAPTNANLGGEKIINTISRIAKAIKESYNFNRIGISTAGQVDYKSGTIVYATNSMPNWTGVKVKEILENELNVKVAVENDVNCAALGELHYGAGINNKNFIILTYGTGIGGAIIQDGNLLKGEDGIAGEVGHIITHANGELCTCGNKGCYEAYASTNAMLKKVYKKTGVIYNGYEVFNIINSDNHVHKKILISIVDNWIDEIIIGLISLVYIFNPKLIVVGGGIMEQEIIINKINKNIKKYVMPSFNKFNVSKPMLQGLAGIYGGLYISNKL